MSWFSGSGQAPGPERRESLKHRSLALPQLLRSLRLETRPSLLDLGAAVDHNLQFLSAYSCRVRIADLHRSVQAEPVESRTPEAFPALLPRLLPLERGERFDAILAWDILNYLRPDQSTAVMSWLGPACTPRTTVFALISTLRQIPIAPLRYRILDEQHLAWEGPPVATRPSPRLTQQQVRRMTPGFSVRNSYILRNGMQEFLLETGTQKTVASAVPVAPATRRVVVR